ncbi:hypothetical protein Nepgr_028283 [Nepenthes gracilis]|uniref:Uncharacterized protein n=1 Tax=Nepenthes gracilis TaxID=150966 RepID=A0AAD3TBE8_NEPGR|nr:hypothetical protein Nepgr_028283 [Nepenthes gracilis]
MAVLTDLAIIFASLYALVLIVFFAYIFSLLRCQAHTQPPNDIAGEVASREPFKRNSKELVYLLCCMRHNSILPPQGPDSTPAEESPEESPEELPEESLDTEVDIYEMMTAQGIYCPPRFLSPIEEDEREGMESCFESDDATNDV